MVKHISHRAEEFVNIFFEELSKENLSDRSERCIAKIINHAADRLCTDWGELQHPADVLKEMANEVYPDMEEEKITIIFLVKKWAKDIYNMRSFRSRLRAEIFIDEQVDHLLQLADTDAEEFISLTGYHPDEFDGHDDLEQFLSRSFYIEKLEFVE